MSNGSGYDRAPLWPSRRHNEPWQDEAAMRTLARLTVSAGEGVDALAELLMMCDLIESPPAPDVRSWHGRPRRAEKRAS